MRMVKDQRFTEDTINDNFKGALCNAWPHAAPSLDTCNKR